MHTTYDKRLGHIADFKVEYHFYSEDEGGRKTIPHQGYRSDFWYEHPEHSGTNQVFMIWPEFENEKGEIIMDDDLTVHEKGTARMWVIVPGRRQYHLGKIEVGITGYFMEGSRRVAVCTVREILGLSTNPQK